jgi:hypothetical protein
MTSRRSRASAGIELRLDRAVLRSFRVAAAAAIGGLIVSIRLGFVPGVLLTARLGVTPESLAQSSRSMAPAAPAAVAARMNRTHREAQEEFAPDDRQFRQRRRGNGAEPEARPLERGLDREPVGLGVLPSVQGRH